MLRFLPWQIIEGVVKVTDLLRSIDPKVVHIWQDGLVYATGLAALMADVPKIILSSRSVPPPDRGRHNWPEYKIIYRSLLQASNVKFSVNSRYAAGRFADWLDIDPGLIEVIPNGVVPQPSQPDIAAEELFRAFDARTSDARVTVGSVMRLDDNKRPLLWLDTAVELIKRMPARFIIVGDGPLRVQVMRRAEAQSVLDRFLFVGRSDRVGYWLSKMDTFMLLSEFEGLPNALIEAQLAGIPVVTTPAGGAVEALINGVTGFVTSAKPIPEEIANIVAQLACNPECRYRMGASAQKWAADTFPISKMVNKTLDLYHNFGTA
jgi:glycosyltransferase involved in cell wall biosynthesis